MPPDLVMLLCDTARADAFKPWGGRHPSPTMERLCEQGVAYSNATAPAPWTLPSITSIFSGRLPTEHGISNDCVEWVNRRPASPEQSVKSFPGPWLPEELGSRGYRTWAASCNTWISKWGGFDRGFQQFIDLQNKVRLPQGKMGGVLRTLIRFSGRVDHGGRDAVREFRRLLSDAGPQPLFAFVNLMEVHSPYNPPTPFYPYPFWRRQKTFRLSGGRRKGPRPFLVYTLGVEQPPPGYVPTIRELYYHSARYEDSLLGEFIASVEDRGRPTVVVVVSDHGENLGEDGKFGHNTSLAQTVLRVPLVVWGHKVDVGHAWIEDPVPLLGLPHWLLRMADGGGDPPAGDGPVVSEYESAERWIPPQLRAVIEAGGSARLPGLAFNAGVAIRKGRLKYVALEDGQESLYDVQDDTGEDRDILTERPDAAGEFRAWRDDWRKRRAEQPRYEAGTVADTEIAEHLRALGYIE